MEPGTPASWQVDPTGRHEHRYWDGERWSDTVSDGGSTSVDPYAPEAAASSSPAAPEPPPAVTPPPVAAAAAPAPAPAPSPAAASPSATPAAPSDGSAAAGSAHVISTFVAGGLALIAVVVIVLILTNL